MLNYILRKVFQLKLYSLFYRHILYVYLPFIITKLNLFLYNIVFNDYFLLDFKSTKQQKKDTKKPTPNKNTDTADDIIDLVDDDTDNDIIEL